MELFYLVKEKKKVLMFLANIIGTKNLKHNNKINKLNNKCGKYHYVYLKHPIKDKWGRIRVTLILWECGSVTQDDIEETVKIAGLEIEEYKKTKENSKKRFFYILIILKKEGT